jgi:16S rRNA processing protein RimM
MPKSAAQSSSAVPAAEKRVLVGRIGAPHGLKGDVRLTSFTQDPKAIGGYRLTDAHGERRFTIIALRPLKGDLVVARFEGVATREGAEALNNIELYITRDALPAPAEDEFYHADLIGLTARNAAGAHIGHVANVQNFGGGDILEIAPSEGGETLLVPFTKEAVPVIDFEAREVVVVPPAEIEADPLPEGEGGRAAAG